MWSLIQEYIDELDWHDILFFFSGMSFSFAVTVLWVFVDNPREWDSWLVSVCMLIWLALGSYLFSVGIRFKKDNK